MIVICSYKNHDPRIKRVSPGFKFEVPTLKDLSKEDRVWFALKSMDKVPSGKIIKLFFRKWYPYAFLHYDMYNTWRDCPIKSTHVSNFKASYQVRKYFYATNLKEQAYE